MSYRTPGPWRVVTLKGEDYPSVIARINARENYTITKGGHPDKATHTANCHLIAAAPDLLKSLKDVLDVVAIMQNGIIPDYSYTYKTVFQPALELIENLREEE